MRRIKGLTKEEIFDQYDLFARDGFITNISELHLVQENLDEIEDILNAVQNGLTRRRNFIVNTSNQTDSNTARLAFAQLGLNADTVEKYLDTVDQLRSQLTNIDIDITELHKEISKYFEGGY